MTKGYYHTCETCNERYYYEVTKNLRNKCRKWQEIKRYKSTKERINGMLLA